MNSNATTSKNLRSSFGLWFLFVMVFLLFTAFILNRYDDFLGLLLNKGYLKSFLYSTPIVLSSIFFSLFFGTMLAKSLVKNKDIKIINLILSMVIYTPHFIFAYYIYELFGKNFQMQKLGINIVFAYVLKLMPFVALYLIPALEKIPKSEIELMEVMGASKISVFINLELKRILSSYVEIIVILLSFIYTAYEIPYILSITYPKFLSVLIYDNFYYYSVDGKGGAILIMIIFTFIITLLNIFLLILKKLLEKPSSNSSYHNF